MIILILPREKLLNFGHEKLRKVMEKVLESHGSYYYYYFLLTHRCLALSAAETFVQKASNGRSSVDYPVPLPFECQGVF